MRTDKEISELLELHYGIPTDPNLLEELRSCYLNKVVEHTPQDIFKGNCRNCGKRNCICSIPLGFFTKY